MAAVSDWTTPRDWATDENPSAATLNTHIRNNLEFVGNKPLGLMCRALSTQTINNSTNTRINFDTSTADPLGMNDLANDRIVAPAYGAYSVRCQATFSASSAAACFLLVCKNSGGAWSASSQIAGSIGPGNPLLGTPLNCSQTVVLNANDYVEAFVYQNSGTSLTLATGAYTTNLQMMFVSTLGSSSYDE